MAADKLDKVMEELDETINKWQPPNSDPTNISGRTDEDCKNDAAILRKKPPQLKAKLSEPIVPIPGIG